MRWTGGHEKVSKETRRQGVVLTERERIWKRNNGARRRDEDLKKVL